MPEPRRRARSAKASDDEAASALAPSRYPLGDLTTGILRSVGADGARGEMVSFPAELPPPGAAARALRGRGGLEKPLETGLETPLDRPEGRAGLALGIEPGRPLSVSELTGRLRGLLQAHFPVLMVEGEVSGCRPAPSGHASRVSVYLHKSSLEPVLPLAGAERKREHSDNFLPK